MGIFPINIRNQNQDRLENHKFIQPQATAPAAAVPQIRSELKPETDYMKLGSVSNNVSGTYTAAAKISPLLKGFLDKVASGTVTDNDLATMRGRLQQANPLNPNGSSTGKPSEMKVFLDKVADGSVTRDDLTQMQTKLQQVRQNAPAVTAADRNKQEIDLGFFLKKVANGSVTPDDLEHTRDVLQQMEQSGNDTLFRHQHRMDNFSNNNGTDLKNFLGKVADGQVTDDDLKSMRSELQKMEQHFGFM